MFWAYTFGKEKKKTKRRSPEPDYITFDVPNDGKFKVLNTIESLAKI